MVYFSTVHSIISYGIIFWGISVYSKIRFKIQKRIIRIVRNSDNKISCRDLFKKLYILPLQSQYEFSLITFVVKNKDFFKMNSDIHSFITRSNHDLYIPVANLTVFQKGVWCSGIKIYNHLPPALNPLNAELNPICHLLALLGAHHILHISRIRVKQLSHDIPKFKAALKRFLLTKSFYTLEEYYSWK
jgi:hypothetical protein